MTWHCSTQGIREEEEQCHDRNCPHLREWVVVNLRVEVAYHHHRIDGETNGPPEVKVVQCHSVNKGNDLKLVVSYEQTYPLLVENYLRYYLGAGFYRKLLYLLDNQHHNQGLIL